MNSSSVPQPMPEHELLRLAVQEHGPDVAALVASGEIDLYTAGRFRSEAAALLARHRHVVVDLAEVRFLGSAGFQALADLHNLRTGSLHVSGGSRTIRRALGVSGMDRYLSLYPTLAEALVALG